MAKPHARPGRHPMRESLAVFRAVAVRRDMLVLTRAGVEALEARLK